MLSGSGGIRTHASEETGALNQRLRPLGHATSLQNSRPGQDLVPKPKVAPVEKEQKKEQKKKVGLCCCHASTRVLP